MKPLTCEMCGSTDLVKQDGVFVCQACGVKYSVEEARKMMAGDGPVEIRGTVAIDNSKDAERYLNLARSAATGSNHEEALSYANKVLEIDDSNWEAYFIKGTAAAWASKLGHNNFDDATVCWSTAISLAPDEEALDVTENCMREMKNVYTAMLSLRLSTVERALDSDRVSDCASELAALKRQNLNNTMVILLAVGQKGLADKIDVSQGLGVVPLAQFNKNVSACAKHACESIKIWTGSQSLGSGARDAVGAVAMHETIIPWLDGKDKLSACSALETAYNQISSSLRQAQFDAGSMSTFYSSLRQTKSEIQEENRKKEQEAAEERRREQEEKAREYWSDHPEEKKEIEQEKSDLSAIIKKIESEYKAKIDELEREKNALPQRATISEYEKQRSSAQTKLNNMGRAQGKEKEILNQTIADLSAKKVLVESEMNKHLAYLQKRIDGAEAEKSAMIKACNDRTGELKHALSMGKPPKQRTDAIKEILRFDDLREERLRKEEPARQQWANIKADEGKKAAERAEEEKERQQLTESKLKEAAEKRELAKIRRRKRTLAIVIPIVLIIAACVAAYFVTYYKASQYADEENFTEARKWIVVEALTELHDPNLIPYIDAGLLLEAGEYAQAKEAFIAIDAYRKNYALFYKSNYKQAEELIEKGEYAAAIEELEYLTGQNYNDSGTRLLEVKYIYAEQLIAEGKYTAAIYLLEQLAGADYEDAVELLYGTKFVYAEELVAKKDYKEAFTVLEYLVNVHYEGAADLLYGTKYAYAEELIADGCYTAAYAELEYLIGVQYEGAAELLYDTKFAQAKQLILDKDYVSATDELSYLAKRNYEGAEELLQKTRYDGASYYCDKGKYDTALELVKPLVTSNYKGAKTLEQKIRLSEAQSFISRRTSLSTALKTIETLKAEGYKPATDALTNAKKEIYAYAQNLYQKDTNKTKATAAFSALAGYKRSADYLILINAHSNIATLKDLWNLKGFEDADELLLTQYYLLQFLTGEWENGSYYFNFEKKSDGRTWSSYNLPWQYDGDFYGIENGIYYEGYDNSSKRDYQFKFTLVSWDKIKVYCYKDGSTHTLYRQ